MPAGAHTTIVSSKKHVTLKESHAHIQSRACHRAESRRIAFTRLQIHASNSALWRKSQRSSLCDETTLMFLQAYVCLHPSHGGLPQATFEEVVARLIRAKVGDAAEPFSSVLLPHTDVKVSIFRCGNQHNPLRC